MRREAKENREGSAAKARKGKSPGQGDQGFLRRNSQKAAQRDRQSEFCARQNVLTDLLTEQTRHLAHQFPSQSFMSARTSACRMEPGFDGGAGLFLFELTTPLKRCCCCQVTHFYFLTHHPAHRYPATDLMLGDGLGALEPFSAFFATVLISRHDFLGRVAPSPS